MAKADPAATNGTVDDSVAMQVRANLRELTAPLKEQLAELDKRLVTLNRERSDLLEAKREIEKTIRWIEPKQARATGAGALADKTYAIKQQRVESFIRSHGKELAEGFTGGEIHRRMAAEGITPQAGPDTIRKIIGELHERGIVKADRIVKGGGMRYLIVSRDK